MVPSLPLPFLCVLLGVAWLPQHGPHAQHSSASGSLSMAPSCPLGPLPAVVLGSPCILVGWSLLPGEPVCVCMWPLSLLHLSPQWRCKGSWVVLVCLAGITHLARVLCPLAPTPWRAALESCQPVRPTDSPFVCELPVLQQPWGPRECPQVFREQFTCVCVHLSRWEWGRPCVCDSPFASGRPVSSALVFSVLSAISSQLS